MITYSVHVSRSHRRELMAKSSKVKLIIRDRKLIKKNMLAYRKVLTKFLSEQAAGIAKQVTDKVNKSTASDVQKILDDLDFKDWAVLVTDSQSALDAITKSGVAEALIQIGVSDEGITDLANEKAIEYSKARSAELVGMKYVDDELVVNPNAKYAITDGTRELLRSTITDAMEEGWSNDKLSDEIQGSYAFDAYRADVIARTETSFADVAGNMISYRESGVVESKQWIIGDGCCEDCDTLDGVVVGLDEDFPNDGGDGPPLHPQCRCDVIPILTSETNENEED